MKGGFVKKVRFIRLGDVTSHGGTVVTARGNLLLHGRPLALIGDLVFCPRCLGSFAIQPGDGRVETVFARDGDITACGATLIASPDAGPVENATSTSHRTAAPLSPRLRAACLLMKYEHQMRFLIRGIDGKVLPFRDYIITRSDGATKLGRTDAAGFSELIQGAPAEVVSIKVLFRAPRRLLEMKEVQM